MIERQTNSIETQKIMKKVAAYAEQVLNENYRRSVSKWEETNPECEAYTISERR